MHLQRTKKERCPNFRESRRWFRRISRLKTKGLKPTWLPGSNTASSSCFGAAVIAITISIRWAKQTSNAIRFGCFKSREWSFWSYLLLWRVVISTFMWESLWSTSTFGSSFTPPYVSISCSLVQENKSATKRNVIRLAMSTLILISKTPRRKETCGSMALVFTLSLFLWAS